MINAYNNHVIAYGNITGLPAKMSDLLCCLATGAGWGTRKLFEDLDEVNVSLSRPILLDGIRDFATKPDLIERLVRFHSQGITRKKRLTVETFWKNFNRDYPSIFGALLDIMAKAMAILPTLHLDELPRMADFAEWGEAVGRGIGLEPGRFLTIYQDNLDRAASDRLNSDPVVRVIRKFLRENSLKGTSLDPWKGNFKSLLKELNSVVDQRTASNRVAQDA